MSDGVALILQQVKKGWARLRVCVCVHACVCAH